MFPKVEVLDRLPLWYAPVSWMLAVLLWVGLLAVWSPQALAAEAKKGNSVQGNVINITGFREWPRGDTRLGWTMPEPFDLNPDLVYGLGLQSEMVAPVERLRMKRRLEVERLLRQ